MKVICSFIISSLTMSSAVYAEKRLLTMEEAVIGTDIQVQDINCHWTEDPNICEYTLDSTLFRVNVRTGSSTSILIENDSKKPESPKPFAYSLDGNVYYRDKDNIEHAITYFNEPGIVCGESVSRNEFGIEKGIFISPDKSKIAFYMKDESHVTLFPLLDITTRTGTLKEIRYPMNGMDSEIIQLGVYDISKAKTVWLDINDSDPERYLTNVTWSTDSKSIFIQVLNRAQKKMHLDQYDALNGSYIKTILTESNNRYVEPQIPTVFLDDDNFIYTTDNRDGFRNLYICSVKNNTVKRLTNVNADVTYLYNDGNYVYYYSAEISPIERHLYRVSLKTEKSERLTKDEGWHTCIISPEGKYFIDSYSSLKIPGVVNIYSTNGKMIREIFRAKDPTAEINFSPIEMGSIKSADGRFDNYYRLIKPIDFNPNKKYPVILYVYGGPHNQLVTNSFHAKIRNWEMYMAQHGYVVFVMDNRGTPNHGAEYEKAIHRMCGKVEMEDQIEGMKWLMSHNWVDKDRIGVHGWSYGGFMTISLMVNYPDIFKVGVAGGPVIDWRWYEVMYGERYMETEATNKEGLDATSLIPRAKDLKGKLLICQGSMDKTVLWQNSLNFVEECIKEGVQLDYFPYPVHEHNVRGKDRIHLMQKVTDYFDEFLK
jgi:dipeptidyl-peptidase 4